MRKRRKKKQCIPKPEVQEVVVVELHKKEARQYETTSNMTKNHNERINQSQHHKQGHDLTEMSDLVEPVRKEEKLTILMRVIQ